MATNKPQTILEFSNAALDRLYTKSAGPMLAQIEALSTAPNSRLQQSLKKLDEEAARLKEAGKRLEADNAQLQQTLGDYEAALITTATLIQANDNTIQDSAVGLSVAVLTSKVFRALSSRIVAEGGDPTSPQAMSIYMDEIAKTSVKWNVPTAVDFAANYVDSPAWIDRMEKWGPGYADLTRETILSEISRGAGPRAVASKMRQLAENIPRHAAENLTRTLQVTSYRDASLAMEMMNTQYLEGKIRIAKLDDKTCLSCIALHGTPLAVGERVDDHYLGRCTEFYQVAGGDRFPTTMQADSLPGKRRFVPWQTGEEWFASLPPERQAAQASFRAVPAKLNAYRAGTPLSAFVGDHEDAVFGAQIVEKSLFGAVGGDADKYYVRNQPQIAGVKKTAPGFTDITYANKDSAVDIERRAGNWAESLGIDAGQVIAFTDQMPSVLNTPKSVLGAFDPRTGTIYLARSRMEKMSSRAMRGIIAHEYTHKLITDVGLEQFLSLYDDKVDILSAAIPSDYARSYFRRNMNEGQRYLFVNEGLAETARMISDGDGDQVPAPWMDLYNQLISEAKK